MDGLGWKACSRRAGNNGMAKQQQTKCTGNFVFLFLRDVTVLTGERVRIDLDHLERDLMCSFQLSLNANNVQRTTLKNWNGKNETFFGSYPK